MARIRLIVAVRALLSLNDGEGTVVVVDMYGNGARS